MPELGTYGSVPGAPSNGRPYGDQSRPPELRALRCGDGNNGGDDHDEHARGRSGQDGAGRGRPNVAGRAGGEAAGA